MKRFFRIFALLSVLCAVAVAQQPVNNAQVAGASTATAASGRAEGRHHRLDGIISRFDLWTARSTKTSKPSTTSRL